MRCPSCGQRNFGSLVCPVCAGGPFFFDRLSREIKKLREPMELASRQIADEASDIARRYQYLQDDLARSFAPTGALAFEEPSFSKAARAADASILELSRQAEAALEPFSKIYDLASSFALDLDKARSQAARLVEEIHRDWKTGYATAIGDFLSEATSALRAAEISLAGQGFEIDGVAIGPHEIEEFLAGAEDIDLQALPRLIEEQAKPKDKARYVVVLVWFLRNVILPLLISLAAAEIHHGWRDRPAERKATIRLVKEKTERRAAQVLEAGLPRQALARFRLVTAGTLNVRVRPARNSPRIGELHLGDVVYAVRSSRRSWTLVEWTATNGEAPVRGWVFSRYLEKLRLPQAPSATDAEQLNRPIAGGLSRR